MRTTTIATAIFTLLGLITALKGNAQSITGKVTDTTGKAIPYASAKLIGAGNLILAYSVTNEKGVYSITPPAGTDTKALQIEISSVGFARQSKPVTGASGNYDFTLKVSNNQLQAVQVTDKTPRLRTHGDTLDYKVADFTGKQDRVIGDVIRKLPGIDVDANGKIKYNGKAISNLYIGGDNLLDDKYNIATSTIPSDAVEKVQVMENHQPVKMLKDKVMSDDVALNLTIKKDAKLQLVGQGNIGGGAPGKYDGNINAMMFRDKYKAINYLKGNNTGVDVQNDLTSHNYSSYMSRLDNNKPANLLSLGAAGNPNLPTNRYLFNNSGLLNLNNLVNLKKDVQLKANVSYLHDVQKQDYRKIEETYLPDDTIRYTEFQNNKRRPDLVHAQATLNINRSNYYLNNNFINDYEHYSSYSGLNTNGNMVGQNLKNSRLDFSNEFNMMTTAKSGKILELYSYINRVTNPENRDINPGLNIDTFNDGVPYSSLMQSASLSSWFTNNYFSFKLPGRLITQQYKFGGSYQAQNLTSALSSVQTNGMLTAALDSSVNNLNWRRSKLYAEAAFDSQGEIWKFTLSVPISLQHINYSDANYALDQSLTRLLVNPQLRMKYQTGPETFFSLMYNLRNDIGDVNEAYRGYILTNYRTLYANNAALTERTVQTAALGYNYRKAIKMFFWSVSAIYSHTDANNISSSLLNANFQRRIVLPFDNNTDNWMLAGNISKYIYLLHTTFSGGISWQSNRYNQILNNIMLPYNTYGTSYTGSIETKVTERLNLSYKLFYTLTSSSSQVAQASASRFTQMQHQGTINYTPLDNLFIKLSADRYITKRRGDSNNLNYFFADLSTRYKINKLKTDLELTVINLFDTREYSTVALTANRYTNSVYTLPGRMATLKVAFNF